MGRVVEQDREGAAILALRDQLIAAAVGGIDALHLRDQFGTAFLGDEV
jgi:hypothetical protein